MQITTRFLQVVMIAAFVSLTGSCVAPMAPTASPIPNSTPTPLPILKGRLLLQQIGLNIGDYKGLYEIQAGWSEPRKVNDLGFDISAINGFIQAVTQNWRYIVYSPDFLLDTHTNSIVRLPTPGITAADSDFHIVSASFSPDFNRLVYVTVNPGALFVYEPTTKKAALLLNSSCAKYNIGLLCEYIGKPNWIDSDTLIFKHHIGLSPIIETDSPGKDPRFANHLTAITPRGEILLSIDLWDGYEAVGGTVFSLSKSSNAWFDGATLRKGIIEPHKFPGLPPQIENLQPSSQYLESSTISPDGRYILREMHSKDTTRLSLIEVRTGNETLLGPTEISGLYIFDSCVWSPDQTWLACRAEWQNQGRQRGIVVIPISQEASQIIATDDTVNSWELLGWLPH